MQHDLKTENPESKLRSSINNQIRDTTINKIKLQTPLMEGSFNAIYTTDSPQIVASVSLKKDSEKNTYLLQADQEAKHAAELMSQKNVYFPFIHLELYKQENEKLSERGFTDLFFHLKGKGNSPLEKNKTTIELREIIGQIIFAIEYLHGIFIVHRDLKLENILVFFREIWIDQERKKIEIQIKIGDPDTYQEVDKEGRFLWKEAKPKGTEDVCSEEILKLNKAWVSGTYTERDHERYHSLNHFLEELYTLGKTIEYMLPNFAIPDDFKPLLPLITRLTSNDPNQRDITFEAIKSNAFFGATDEIRKRFFKDLFLKFKLLDNSSHESAKQNQSRQSLLANKDILDFLDKKADSKLTSQSLEQLSREKTATRDKFELTAGINPGDPFNFLPDEMKSVVSAWEKLTSQYDFIKSLLKEKFEKPEEILNTEVHAMIIIISFGKVQEELLKAIQELKKSPYYENYKDPSEQMINWIKNYGQPLKQEFLTLTQILSQQRLHSHSGENLIPRSSTTLNTTPKRLSNSSSSSSLSSSTPTTPVKKGPPPIPQELLRANSSLGKPQSTSSLPASSPPAATPEKKDQSPQSIPPTLTTPSSLSAPYIRLPGLGGPLSGNANKA